MQFWRLQFAIAILALASAASSPATTKVNLQVSLGHHSHINSVAFSPDGKRVLSGDAGGAALLWEVATGRQIRRFHNTEGTITSVAFSPDRHTILIASGNAITLLNESTGREIRQFTAGSVHCAAFSRDGHRIVVGTERTVQIWDTGSGRMIRHFEGFTGWVEAVAFSPNGRQILAGGLDGIARMWDAENGSEIRQFKGHSQRISSVAFSPDGLQVLTGSQDKSVRLWDSGTGTEIRQFQGHTAWVFSVAFSEDGKRVLTGAADYTVRMWDTPSGKEIWKQSGYAGTALLVAFSPDSKTIVTGCYTELILSNALDGGEIRELTGGSEKITSVAFSPHGGQIATGSSDNTAALWDVPTGKVLRRFKGHGRGFLESGVTSVAFCPDGNQLVTGGQDSTARLWDIDTGTEIRKFAGHSDAVTSLAISSDGKDLLTGSDDNTARLWSLSSGQEIRRFVGHTGLVTSVAFSPDGTKLVTGSTDASVRLWDANTGAEIRQFIGHSQRQPVVFSEQLPGKIRTYEQRSGAVTSVAFSPDGAQLLTGGKDSIAILWEVSTGTVLRRLLAPNKVTTVAFAPDGKRVLTGDKDGNVQIWDLSTGAQIGRLQGIHADSVSSLAMSPAGPYVLTGSDDGSTVVWSEKTVMPVVTLVTFRDEGWAVVGTDGRFDTSELDGGAPLSWIVMDQPLRPLPLEIFMRQYYTPRLLTRRVAPVIGNKLPNLPSIAGLNRIQPEVEVIDVQLDAANADTVQVTVTVKPGGDGSPSRDLRLFRDGQLVRTVSGNLRQRRYKFTGVRLAHHGPKQEVLFSAYAFNSDLVKSETRKKPYQVPSNWPERHGQVFLVNVGIDQTTARGCNLEYAVSDATKMRAVLVDRFRVAGYVVDPHLLAAGDARRIVPHSDEVTANGAAKRRVQTTLADIARRATPDDVFILSYSGHGYTDAAGEFYILPSDLKGNCDRVDKALISFRHPKRRTSRMDSADRFWRDGDNSGRLLFGGEHRKGKLSARPHGK